MSCFIDDELEIWCGRRDLNPHDLRHWLLRPARLPFRHPRVRVKYSVVKWGCQLFRERLLYPPARPYDKNKICGGRIARAHGCENVRH